MAVDHAAPIFGRDRELAELVGALGLEPSGEPVAGDSVLLGGDAGIGKTRVVTEIASLARDAGHLVLVGHCLDLGDNAMPFQPFVEALSSLEPTVHDALVEDSPALAGLVASPDAQAGGERADVLSAVARALDDLAANQPVVMIVEDAHWADASTRHLLQFLLARRFTHPVSLVVSYRTDDLHRRHPLRAAVAEWSRLPGVRRLELEPLDDTAVDALLRAREATRLSDRGAAAIIRRAGGNAFYAEELLDAGLAEGALPESLADLVLVRLDRLAEDARTVVAAIACAGGPVGDALLAEVVGLDASALEHALRDALDHKVLVSLGDTYWFRHALLAEAVRDDLLAGQRRRFHTAFLAALTRPDETGPAREVAFHAEAAGELGTAFTASVEAGDDAVRVGGYDEAAGHFRRALDLLSAAPDDTDIVGLVLAASNALFATGRLRTASQLLREHVGHLPADDLVGRGRLLLAIGNAAYHSEDDAEALEVSAEALAVIPEDATLLRAELDALLARTHASMRHYDQALEHAERALAVAEAEDGAQVIADAQSTVTYVLSRTGDDADKTQRRYAELIEASRASGDIHNELRGLQHLAFVHLNAGDLEEADRYFREGMARAEATGRAWAPYGFDGRWFTSVTSYLRGRWDDVLSLRDVDADATDLVRAALDSVALLVAVGRGEPVEPKEIDRLRAEWTRDIAIAVQAGSGMIDLYGHAGDIEGAEEVHDALVDVLARVWHTALSPARLRMAGLLIGQYAAAAPRRSAAENAAAVERAIPLAAEADQAAAEWPALGLEGRAWHQRVHAELARLRWATGIDPVPPAEMERLWRTVVEAFDELGEDYEKARSETRLAAVLKAAGNDAEARTLTSDAKSIAQSLGARPLLEEIGGRGSREPAADLTPRESEVLALVSAGRTNGEIAAQLFISTKTASVHVSNILAKLGASGRTEAAAIARRRGLVDG